VADMTVKITDSLVLKNPVLTCSGTFGYGEEFAGFMDLDALGGITTKAITLEPREGNPPPRIVETSSGMLNAIGLENVGVEAFIRDKLPFLSGLDTAVIVNVAGSTEDEYVKVVERLDGEKGVDGFEINISCPNVQEGGIAFGGDAACAASLVGSVRSATDLPVITKLSPNVTDISEIARAAVDAGSDALSLVNTFRGMAIDASARKPVLGNVVGGLSGPAIKPLALYNIYKVSLSASVPIIGMGGISSALDAVEFILAGAHAVSVGTANFVNPDIAMRIAEGIEEYCVENGVDSVRNLIGAAR